MDEQTEPREHFTDEEAAFLRYVRFGELPPRVLPSEMVETVEADTPSVDHRRTFDPYDPAAGRMIR
jgi:hypothetical protein